MRFVSQQPMIGALEENLLSANNILTQGVYHQLPPKISIEIAPERNLAREFSKHGFLQADTMHASVCSSLPSKESAARSNSVCWNCMQVTVQSITKDLDKLDLTLAPASHSHLKTYQGVLQDPSLDAGERERLLELSPKFIGASLYRVTHFEGRPAIVLSLKAHDFAEQPELQSGFIAGSLKEEDCIPKYSFAEMVSNTLSQKYLQETGMQIEVVAPRFIVDEASSGHLRFVCIDNSQLPDDWSAKLQEQLLVKKTNLMLLNGLENLPLTIVGHTVLFLDQDFTKSSTYEAVTLTLSDDGQLQRSNNFPTALRPSAKGLLNALKEHHEFQEILLRECASSSTK